MTLTCGCSSRDDGNEQTEVRRSSFASSADSKYRLTPREHQALRPLAPTREVYGKPPLPIEILSAGGPKALRRFTSSAPVLADRSGPRSLSRPLPNDRAGADSMREWLRKGTA